MFRANTQHPLFKEVHNILLKTLGIDQIIETVIERLGQVEKVFLIGGFAKGLDSPIIDLIFIGDIDKNFLMTLAEKAEELIHRKIRYMIYQLEEFEKLRTSGFHEEALLLWAAD